MLKNSPPYSLGVFRDFADRRMTFSFICFQVVILLLNVHHIRAICFNPPFKSTQVTFTMPTLLAAFKAGVISLRKRKTISLLTRHVLAQLFGLK